MNQLVTPKTKILIRNNKLSESSSFGFIFSLLDINIPEHASTLTQFSFSVFLLSLVALFCFINVLDYFIVYILIQKGDYEKSIQN